MKVGEKTNFGRLATIFQICSMDADILSEIHSNVKSVYPSLKVPLTTKYQCLVGVTEIFN